MKPKPDLVKLSRRRDQILATLSYLAAQKKEVDENTEWKDAASQRRRQIFLSDLYGWYLVAIEQVERALARVPDNRFVLCMTCFQPIEPQCLEASPEAEFCMTCQRQQEN
jgi:RNA polymerase-binding transcription factor DksA